MFTWGPQSSAPTAPPPPAPVANFYALRTGSVLYHTYNAFEPNGSSTIPLDPSALVAPHFAQDEFNLISGAGTPYDFESDSATSSGSYSATFVDSLSGIGVTVTAATGQLADIPAGTTDNFGRYSVPYSDGGGGWIPADGGSKCVVLTTNGQTVGFAFSRDVASFGLYMIDMMDFGGTVTLKTRRDGVDVYTESFVPSIGTGAANNGSVGFVGYIARTVSALFDELTLTFSATAADLTAFDNLFVAPAEAMLVLNVSVGQTIQFTDLSTNTPTSWSWNFGDSTTSTAQNPTKSYSAAGTYNVTLTATNAGGSDSETKTGFIVVS